MGSHHCIHRAQHCYFFVFTENGREAQGECKESLRVLKRCSLKKELFKFHSIFIDLPYFFIIFHKFLSKEGLQA